MMQCCSIEGIETSIETIDDDTIWSGLWSVCLSKLDTKKRKKVGVSEQKKSLKKRKKKKEKEFSGERSDLWAIITPIHEKPGKTIL